MALQSRHMADWIAKLDDFLKLSDRDILTHAGRISQDQASEHARIEFEKFRAQRAELISPVEQDFAAAVEAAKGIVMARKG